MHVSKPITNKLILPCPIQCKLRKKKNGKEKPFKRTPPLLGSNYTDTRQWSINKKYIYNSLTTSAPQLTPKKENKLFLKREQKVLVGNTTDLIFF